MRCCQVLEHGACDAVWRCATKASKAEAVVGHSAACTTPLTSLPPVDLPPPQGHPDTKHLSRPDWHPDGGILLAVPGTEHDVVLYERMSWSPTGYLAGGHTEHVNCTAFSPNGRYIATAGGGWPGLGVQARTCPGMAGGWRWGFRFLPASVLSAPILMLSYIVGTVAHIQAHMRSACHAITARCLCVCARSSLCPLLPPPPRRPGPGPAHMGGGWLQVRGALRAGRSGHQHLLAPGGQRGEGRCGAG
jgi:hypothetical protein